jgi:hypothetical protein
VIFHRRFIYSFAIIVFAVSCGVAGPAAGDVVYNSGGFEPPLFVPGDLTNQDPLNGPWQKSGINSSTAVVQISNTQSGVQAVQVTRAANANGDARWAVVKPVANAVLVAVDWDMNVQQSTITSGFGPFIGVEAYDGLDNPPALAGSMGVDAATGDVLYQATGSGVLTETGTTVPFNSWNHYRLLLDYANDKYSVFLNGSLLATQDFVDPGIDDFTDAPIALLAAAGDPISLAAGGTAYVDNYTIQHVVPEPTLAWVVFSAGIFCRTTARRRAAKRIMKLSSNNFSIRTL